MTQSSSLIPVAIAYGDGIGPEIMTAVLHVLQEAGAPLEFHALEVGEKVYLRGVENGIEEGSWDILKNTKCFLKAPITTPQGGGFKSINVTIRTTLGLYANVRPCASYSPFIATKHPKMDVVIVRENEEDLYMGIEYRQTPDMHKSLKLISRPGSEKIVRYAFEYARHFGRKKVTCFTKDNVMKISDGLFHKVFNEIATEYPDIVNEHWIVDIGAAKLADTPEAFDVIVLPNLYGDILSDVAAQISGSVGIAGSANIGERGAMFEAIHGSAPRRAGQNVANPSGLLLAAVQMLLYLDETVLAERVHNAWLLTVEEGIHTYDIFKEGISKDKVGTSEFARAVVKNLGSKPKKLQPVCYTQTTKVARLPTQKIRALEQRQLVGVDVFVYVKQSTEDFIRSSAAHPWQSLHLKWIGNRGVRVWPGGHPETRCVDQFRLRFVSKHKTPSVSYEEISKTLLELNERGFDITGSEHLYTFDGANGFS
jgi:isocitrate dehydrogenase